MVDSTFLAIGAAVFVAILIFILRNNAKEEPQKPSRRDRQKQQPKQQPLPKEKKPKKAPRKGTKNATPSEWDVVDNAKEDAKEMLEFLKGKDPSELAKANKASAPKQAAVNKKKQAKKAKEEASSSDDSASEGVTQDGFEQVKKKVVTDKKKTKKDKKVDEGKQAPTPVAKPYFRALNPDGTPVKEEKPQKGERRPRREGDAPFQGERKPRVEGEIRERKPRPEGEQRERKEGDNDKPREPRPPREPREPKEARRPITSPPNVKYEEADMDDILDSITQVYKPKPKIARVSSVFSKFERDLVLKICAKLEARDLARLSRVNHYFLGVARKESLWRELLVRDFALKDTFKLKSCRQAYKAEYKKKHKKPKADAAVPQGEQKDTKPKNTKKAEETQE